MKFDQLITSLRDLDGSLKRHVSSSSTTNVGLTVRNWLVGAYIVGFEQNGEDRASSGESLLSNIAKKLSIRGLSVRSLEASEVAPGNGESRSR